MFSVLRKLSGESTKSQDCADENEGDLNNSRMKRHRSGASPTEPVATQKRKKFECAPASHSIRMVDSIEEGELVEPGENILGDASLGSNSTAVNLDADIKLPPETPDWGIQLLKIIQMEFRNVTKSVGEIDLSNQSNTASIKEMEQKLEKVETHNKSLENENINLCEKLLELEYRQKRNNLIFEGITDAEGESDYDCIMKLRNILKCIPGLDQSFRVDRCHRLDGTFNPNRTRRLICTFNWYVDMQFILRNRKHLPKGIFVNEDLPDEWQNRRKVLKPIFNTAKRMDSLKHKTHMSKDKLIINGKTFSSAPVCNISEANNLLNVKYTCERTDQSKTLFFGSHSPFSNLFLSEFTIDNVKYNCVEQYL